MTVKDLFLIRFFQEIIVEDLMDIKQNYLILNSMFCFVLKTKFKNIQVTDTVQYIRCDLMSHSRFHLAEACT